MADATLSLYREVVGTEGELVESGGPSRRQGRVQRVGLYEEFGQIGPECYLLFLMGLQCSSNTFEITDQRFSGSDALDLLVP